jgi:hypothetical protein
MKVLSNLILSGSAVLNNGALVLPYLSGSGSFTGSLGDDKIGIYYDSNDNNIKVINATASLGVVQLSPSIEKSSIQIGNGVNNIFIINHNLDTRNIIVSVRETNAPFEMVYPDIIFQDLNNMAISFGAEIPDVNEYTVTYL